jgi:energy-coupling factor transport system ATP-binding protein
VTAHPRPTAATPHADVDALLRLRNVGVTHFEGDRPTPADVSFDVSPGEVVLVLGPSGSGKSTLAMTMNGLIPHAVPGVVTGTVTVGGRDAATSSVSELAPTVAMVFQDPDAQLITGTVLDEVCFGPENLRLPVAEVLARAEAALRRVGLWDRRDKSPDVLSGGGRQRLAIACALAMASPLLVLDEPTASLDPAGVAEVYAALRDVVAAGDRAIVLIEHDLDAAVGLVDRVVALDGEGRVVADGDVDEVLRGRAGQLHELGVWLPTATLAALRLRRAGYALPRLPLTPGELRTELDAAAPPALASDPRPVQDRPVGEPIVRVRDLRVTRGRSTVLHDVDLDVSVGEFVAVVGPNGAGKTTLVQAIAGVRRPPRGTVVIDGRDVRRLPARVLSRHVGFVFQNPEHQFVTTTVFDELAHGLRRRRIPEAEVRSRVEEMLARFGLHDRADAHPFLLSGGQKRRLSVGTALVGGARVLVLDEPTYGQDRARADEMLAMLDDLRAGGTTIIVVTHDLQLVAEHADRVVVMDAGRLAAEAPVADLIADVPLLERMGLGIPPLHRAFAGLRRHPELSSISRLRDLPGGDR